MRLEVVDGSFAYPDSEPILRGMSFSLETPEILAILGANGAGKTTLLKCLLGFERWTSGATLLDGVDIARLSPRAFWARVGYVAQARQSLFALTVEEMVVLGRSVQLGALAKPGARDWQKVQETLELLGIAHLSRRLCDTLSGGQLQLALMARALVCEPELLVLDEPESNLDYKNQTVILSVLERLAREKGIGSIINTHYPAHALEISDKALLYLPEGKYLFGETQSVVTAEHLSESFGVPVRIVPLGLPERPRLSAVAAVPKH